MCSDVPDNCIAAMVEKWPKEFNIGGETVIQEVKSIDSTELRPDGRKIGIVCPECAILGAESRVTMDNAFGTSAGVLKYHDAKGYHEHDPNITRAKWICSRGHAGDYEKRPGCNVEGCSRTEYGILTTDPYNFASAKKHRAELEEKKRREVTSSVAPATVIDQTRFTNIANDHYCAGGVYYATATDYSSISSQVPAISPEAITITVMFNGQKYSGTLQRE
jgi:hypothetical protein